MKMKMKTQSKIYETSKRISNREAYGDTCPPQETRKISNKQTKLTPKGTRKRRTNKIQLVE